MTVHGTTGGGGNGIAGTLVIKGSIDGSTYSTISGTSQAVLEIPTHTHVFNWGPISTGSYIDVKIGWTVGGSGYNEGYFDTGTWTTTAPVLPVVPPPVPQPVLFNQTIVQTGPVSNPWGVDIKCVNDLDPYFSLVGGIQCLAQDLYHRITTSPGTVPGAPNFGFNSIGLLSQAVTQAELNLIQSQMTTQLLSDERVQSASVLLTYSNGSLTVTATIQPLANGPFQFIASISSIGASLLSVSPVLA